MSLHYAKYRLTQWGKWSRDPPALISNWRLWFSGGSRDGEMPIDVEEVNRIINRMDKDLRVVLVVHYCRVGPSYKKAQQIDMPILEYRRKVDEAEWFVHIELDNQNCQVQTLKSDRAVTLTR